MNKKGQFGQGTVIFGLAVAALIGFVLLAPIVSELTNITSTNSVTDEAITVAISSCTAYTDNDDWTTNATTFFANSSVGVLTEGTDYQICSKRAGTVAGITANFAGAINTNYTYFPDGYLVSTSSRAMALLVPLAIAIALMVFVFAGAGITS